MQAQNEFEMFEGEQKRKAQPYVSITSVPSTPNNEAAEVSSSPSEHKSFLEETVDKWWLWELVAWSIAVLSLMGIVILLETQNHKPVPNWSIKTTVLGKQYETKITINAVISIFSTILKSTIMIPVAAAISQLKWLWFHDGRNPLSDVQLFDAANRGPLGSIILVWQMRGRQVVCLGAVVIITMLGLDFAFQSIVTYPLKSVANPTAYVPAVRNYTSVQNAWSAEDSHVDPTGGVVADPRLKSAMRSIMYDVNSPFLITPNCPTGNCTWAHQYVSLGVCSECFDATDALNKTCGMTTDFLYNTTQYSCNYSWPDTANYDSTFDTSFNMIPGISWPCAQETNPLPCATQLTTSTNPSFNHFFKDLVQPLTILSVMNAEWNSTGLAQVNATQCALKLCAKKYQATMSNNVFKETLVDEYVNETAEAYSSYDDNGTEIRAEYSITPPEMFMNGTDSTSPTNFATTLDVVASISAVIGNVWDGYIAKPGYTTKVLGQTDVTTYLQSLDNEGITQMMSSLAGNMTNAMRMSVTNRTDLSDLNGVGQVKQNEPFVEVHWAWLVLPIFELAMTLLFLLLTMQASAKHKGMLWKGSALAPFYYPLTKDGREKVGSVVTPRQMESIASELKVKWEETDRGLRLVQHRDTRS